MARHADFSERHESSGAIADESESNLVCHETAHDAPVNALTKIDAIRRAHGVRVNQRQSQNETLRFKDEFGFALGLPNGRRYRQGRDVADKAARCRIRLLGPLS